MGNGSKSLRLTEFHVTHLKMDEGWQKRPIGAIRPGKAVFQRCQFRAWAEVGRSVVPHPVISKFGFSKLEIHRRPPFVISLRIKAMAVLSRQLRSVCRRKERISDNSAVVMRGEQFEVRLTVAPSSRDLALGKLGTQAAPIGEKAVILKAMQNAESLLDRDWYILWRRSGRSGRQCGRRTGILGSSPR